MDASDAWVTDITITKTDLLAGSGLHHGAHGTCPTTGAYVWLYNHSVGVPVACTRLVVVNLSLSGVVRPTESGWRTVCAVCCCFWVRSELHTHTHTHSQSNDTLCPGWWVRDWLPPAIAMRLHTLLLNCIPVTFGTFLSVDVWGGVNRNVKPRPWADSVSVAALKLLKKLCKLGFMFKKYPINYHRLFWRCYILFCLNYSYKPKKFSRTCL